MPKYCQNIAKYAPKYGQTSLNFRSRFQVKISYLGERLVYRTIAAATAHKCNEFKSNWNRINSARNDRNLKMNWNRINSVRNDRNFKKMNRRIRTLPCWSPPPLWKISITYAKIPQNIRHISLNFSQNFVPEDDSVEVATRCLIATVRRISRLPTENKIEFSIF